MPPTVSAVLLVVACVLLTALVALCSRIWTRLRTLPASDVTRLLDELKHEQRALRSVLERLDAGTASGRGSVLNEKRAHRFDEAQASAVPGPTLIAVPNLAAAPDTANAASEELGQRFGPLWSLADGGLSPEAIAQRTGQPIGQVELILGLRRPLAVQTHPHPRAGGRD